jgi:hypothetical protein
MTKSGDNPYSGNRWWQIRRFGWKVGEFSHQVGFYWARCSAKAHKYERMAIRRPRSLELAEHILASIITKELANPFGYRRTLGVDRATDSPIPR